MRTLAVNALRLVGRRTAMGRYLEYLAHHWSQMSIPFDQVIFFTPASVPTDDLRLGNRSQVIVRSLDSPFPLLAWEQILLPWAARRAAGLFCPSYICPLIYRGRIVVANHGIYENIPGEFPLGTRLRTIPLFRLSARRANRLIANSQSTKRDLEHYFHAPESKIDVVYPAANELFFEPQDPASIDREVEKALGSMTPYLLFVGKLSRRRNVPALIEAFAFVRKTADLPHHLLIVGPNSTNLPIMKLAADHGVGDSVKYYEHMEQAQIARLYAGADLYVLPTSHEGISWTMFEAMASGAPVLTVNHATVKEGGLDAVFCVPTPSVHDLAEGMMTLLTSPSLREHYRQAGRVQAAKFSWQETARATMEILDRVALPCDGRYVAE